MPGRMGSSRKWRPNIGTRIITARHDRSVTDPVEVTAEKYLIATQKYFSLDVFFILHIGHETLHIETRIVSTIFSIVEINHSKACIEVVI